MHITSTFGVREALDAIINKYQLDEPKIVKRAQCIKDDIERMKPPIYNLHSRCRRVIEPKKLKTHVIMLHVQGLLPVNTININMFSHCIFSILSYSNDIYELGNPCGVRGNINKNRWISFSCS